MSGTRSKIILILALAILVFSAGCVRMNSPIKVMEKNNKNKLKTVKSIWKHRIHKSPWSITVYVDRVSKREVAWQLSIDDFSQDEMPLFEIKKHKDKGPRDHYLYDKKITRPYLIESKHGKNKHGPTYEVTIKDSDELHVGAD